ncbi:MAG: cob(I)yrinic acid a,c-diamide adenosyltransferase [Candidatus Daviesbacteria bacterium]|nr:cob(I)yrinic acid a,c-diamide adenosyltransferase [Candidatus Daviesbacteria bacterium]
MVIVYTGNGKGKTTAALGLILRSSGYGKKILLIQFIKNSFSGELKSLKKIKGVKVIRGGRGYVGIMGDKLSLEEHKKVAQKTLKKLSHEIKSGNWDLIVADEILGALTGKLIKLADVLEIIKKKPENLDLVLTGRGTPKEIINLSDLATEMKEIKHPFKSGKMAKKGIDY